MHELPTVMKYWQRLQNWEEDFGSDAGWELLLDGSVVAFMDACRFEEMFWHSYQLTPTTDDFKVKALLTSEEFWKGDDWARIIFRNRSTGLIADAACPGTRAFLEPNRIQMRGLYIPSRWPLPWDWCALVARATWRRLHGDRRTPLHVKAFRHFSDQHPDTKNCVRDR